MKRGIREKLQTLLGVLIIIVLVYASYRILRGGWHAYKSLRDNAQIAIAVAFISLAGTLGSLYYTKIKDRQLQIEASHTAKKQDLYDGFVSSMMKLISDSTIDEDGQFSAEMRKDFISSSFLWSNPEVLQTYHRYRLDAQLEEAYPSIANDLATLFLAFRKDLGLSNKGVTQQTILEIMYDKTVLEASGISFKNEGS